MYRSLLGIYFIFAGLTVKERKRRSNVFPLTFDPHGSELKDICSALKSSIAALDRGSSITINGEKQVVCTIYSKARDQLDFDTVLHGRYNHNTLTLRQKEKQLTKNAWKAFCTEWGLAETYPSAASLTPALDIIRTRPTDSEHSEYAGISKLAHDLLMHAILSADGQREYTTQLQSFPFPPGWGRLNSPAHHLDSYRIQKHARSSIIIPVLLRCWLTNKHIKPAFLGGIRSIFVEPKFSNMSLCGIITYVYASIAKSNSVVMADAITTADRARMTVTIIDARRKFQLLQKTAVRADLQKPSRIQSPSPAPSNPLRSQSPFIIDSAPSTPGSEYAAMSVLDTESNKPRAKKEPKSTQYVSDQKRPNMHIGIHHANIAKEYATVFNINGLIGEDKHR